MGGRRGYILFYCWGLFEWTTGANPSDSESTVVRAAGKVEKLTVLFENDIDLPFVR